MPVLGNGDIWECWGALRMMRETGYDAVVARLGCLGRPWLFSELAQVFEGLEPDRPPNMGEVAGVMRDHAARLADLFGPAMGLRQMRKWTTWYTKGFRGSAQIRGRLHMIESLGELDELLGELDSEEAFPQSALGTSRAKRGHRQKVRLPEGYLDDLQDDTPPKGPHTPEEIAAYERALEGG